MQGRGEIAVGRLVAVAGLLEMDRHRSVVGARPIAWRFCDDGGGTAMQANALFIGQELTGNGHAQFIVERVMVVLPAQKAALGQGHEIGIGRSGDQRVERFGPHHAAEQRRAQKAFFLSLGQVIDARGQKGFDRRGHGDKRIARDPAQGTARRGTARGLSAHIALLGDQLSAVDQAVDHLTDKKRIAAGTATHLPGQFGNRVGVDGKSLLATQVLGDELHGAGDIEFAQAHHVGCDIGGKAVDSGIGPGGENGQ